MRTEPSAGRATVVLILRLVQIGTIDVYYLGPLREHLFLYLARRPRLIFLPGHRTRSERGRVPGRLLERLTSDRTVPRWTPAGGFAGQWFCLQAGFERGSPRTSRAIAPG